MYTPKSASTSWKCVLAGFSECSKLISDHEGSYVYIHTDGDLFLKGGLSSYIEDNEVGFSGDLVQPEWYHYKKMMNDPVFLDFLQSENINQDKIYFGRQEGAFFPTNLWLKIINLIDSFYNSTFYENLDVHWPLEEVLIPTLLNKYGYSSNGKNIVNVKKLPPKNYFRDVDANCISTNDLNELYSSTEPCIAAKWFSQNPVHIQQEKKYKLIGGISMIMSGSLRNNSKL